MTPAEFKQARHQLGLSLSDLGRILDVAPRSIRRWEADPDLPTARKPDPIACQVMRWLLSGELQIGRA